jgi:hypothetical protein
MLSSLPVVRSASARFLFLGTALITGVLLQWANQLSPTGAAKELTPIFFRLFTIGDYGGANCALLILLAAALFPARYSLRPVLLWIGNHPVLIAATSAIILSCGALVVYQNSRLCMDEYSQFFQSQIFATGHLAAQFPIPLLNWLIPPGFQDFFLNVSHSSGRVASAYWPSFALLLTPFTWLGIPWACNPVISALTLLSVHRLALRIFADRESAGLAVLLTVASPVFFAEGISYYSMPAHLLANTLFVLLLLDPTPRRAFAAGVIGSVALTLHNPVPHMLFAAPWIVSILRRPGGLPIAGLLFAGYVPLCVLLGLGWFFFSSNLTHEGVKLLSGESSTADTLLRMGSAFALPTYTILLARVIAIAKLWLWAVPGLLVLAGFGAWKWRRNNVCLLLVASALLTLVFYIFIPADQGHGWGYRYFHSAWIALPILAAGAITPVRVARHDAVTLPHKHGIRFFEDAGSRAFVVACALLTLIGGIGYRAVEMHDFISQHESQVPSYDGRERRVVIIDPSFSFYGVDLVQNDPWLRGEVIRMFSHGPAADAQMMRKYFPDMRRVHMDEFGSVWSADVRASEQSALTSMTRP